MILDEIAEYARRRVEDGKKKVSLTSMKTAAENLPKGDFRFERVLKKPGISLICEVKKASPSKEIISEDFPFAEIAREYKAAEAVHSRKCSLCGRKRSFLCP